MKRTSLVGLSLFLATLSAPLFLTQGCGGVIEDDATLAGGDHAEPAASDALRRRRTRTTSTATTGTTTTTTSTTAAPASTATASADDVVAAARTPDGAAIPQPAGANGECPAVVQVLGFWSCSTVDQTCAYSSGGASHRCVCVPTSGEGQYPSWVCD